LLQGHHVFMNRSIRQAMPHDVPRLWEIRQESILTLAPRGMTIAQARKWAASMTMEGMERRFRASEIWITERNGVVTGWIAIRDNQISGLYTDPNFAEKGIGSELLTWAETLLCERGVQSVHLDSSINAEQFYLRRGYEPTGPRPTDDAIPMAKRLSRSGNSN
jgi:putative acetyltransferase